MWTFAVSKASNISPHLNCIVALPWGVQMQKIIIIKIERFGKRKSHFNPTLQRLIRMTLVSPVRFVFWLSGVLNAVFMSELRGLVGPPVHPQWSQSAALMPLIYAFYFASLFFSELLIFFSFQFFSKILPLSSVNHVL